MPYGSRKKKGLLDPDPTKWDRATKERVAALALAEEALDRSRGLESRGWRAWYGEIFGAEFITNLASHHVEAIEWHWNSMVLKRAGMDLAKNAYLAIWPRGHRKSNIIRAIVVCDACIMGEGYALYVSGTKNKVRGHAISIETLISSPQVAAYYPKVASVKRGMLGAQKSWTADLMYAESGYAFHFISLTEGVAGANLDNVRPTLIVLDDIDDRQDSPIISENNFKVLTRSVLPTGQRNTIFFGAQNYISRHGSIYRIHTDKVHVLANRIFTEPIPAVRNMVTEARTIDGIIHDVIVAGTPTWDYYDIPRAQAEIDTIGIEAFNAECQHDVDADKSGAILPEWDEDVHIITWSEFARMFGVHDIPRHWRKYCGWDWGSTEGHACAVSWLTLSAQNSPLPNTFFFYKLMTFPVDVIAGTVARRILNYVLEEHQRDPRRYIELSLLERATSDPGDVLAQRARNQVIEAIGERDDFAMFHASHEAKAVRDICRIIYGLSFHACNPKRDGGIEQLRQYLRVDDQQPHPFRPGSNGRARFYMIVDDEQRLTPKDDLGMKLAREQFPEWRWRPTTLTSKGYMDQRPLKQYDDVGNSIMMLTTHFSLMSTPLTASEQLEAAMPPHLRYAYLRANSPFELGLTPEQELAHLQAVKYARRQVGDDPIERFTEYGERVVK